MNFMPIVAVLIGVLATATVGFVAYVWKNRLKNPFIYVELQHADEKCCFVKITIKNRDKDIITLTEIHCAENNGIKLRLMPQSPGQPSGFGLFDESAFSPALLAINLPIMSEMSESVSLSIWRTLSKQSADARVIMVYVSNRSSSRKRHTTSIMLPMNKPAVAESK